MDMRSDACRQGAQGPGGEQACQLGRTHQDHRGETFGRFHCVDHGLDLVPDLRRSALGVLDNQQPRSAVARIVLESTGQVEPGGSQAVGRVDSKAMADQPQKLQCVEGFRHVHRQPAPVRGKLMDEPAPEPCLAGSGLAGQQDHFRFVETDVFSQSLERISPAGDWKIPGVHARPTGFVVQPGVPESLHHFALPFLPVEDRTSLNPAEKLHRSPP